MTRGLDDADAVFITFLAVVLVAVVCFNTSIVTRRLDQPVTCIEATK